MLVKIFVRTFSSNEDCELFESMLETKWPSLLQTVKGVRFRSLKNPNTPNVSVVIWEFPNKEIMKNIEKLIQENTELKRRNALLEESLKSISDQKAAAEETNKKMQKAQEESNKKVPGTSCFQKRQRIVENN